MLTIRASAQKSLIDGIGLFADEDIPKGAITWTYDPRFDISFLPEELDSFSSLQKDFLLKYSYLSISLKKYILSVDDSRFTNHSSIRSNVESIFDPETGESMGVAKCDIMKGEELLANYREFDLADATSHDDFLSM